MRRHMTLSEGREDVRVELECLLVNTRRQCSIQTLCKTRSHCRIVRQGRYVLAMTLYSLQQSAQESNIIRPLVWRRFPARKCALNDRSVSAKVLVILDGAYQQSAAFGSLVPIYALTVLGSTACYTRDRRRGTRARWRDRSSSAKGVEIHTRARATRTCRHTIVISGNVVADDTVDK